MATSHGELASRFRFLDKSKQRKPVKASEKADKRTGGWRGEEKGKRERGSVSCANGGGFGYVNSQCELGARPAECITNAFCVIRLKR